MGNEKRQQKVWDMAHPIAGDAFRLMVRAIEALPGLEEHEKDHLLHFITIQIASNTYRNLHVSFDNDHMFKKLLQEFKGAVEFYALKVDASEFTREEI